MTDVFSDQETSALLNAKQQISADIEANGDRAIGAGQGVTNLSSALDAVDAELLAREPSTEEMPNIPVGEEFAQVDLGEVTDQATEQPAAPTEEEGQGDAIDRFLDTGELPEDRALPPEGTADPIDSFLDTGQLPQTFLESDDPQIQNLVKRTEALRRSFESRSGRPGTMEARGTFNAAREIEKLAELREQGVDIEAGIQDFGQRMERAFIRRDETLDAFFRNNFQDFRHTGAGTVVTVQDEGGASKEVLFDETGLSLSDIADSSPELLEVMAAVAGATAVAATGVVSVPVLAMGAAIAEFSTGTTAEAVVTMKNGGLTQEEFIRIAKEQGQDAAINFALDTFLAAGGRIVRFASGPFGQAMRTDPGAAIQAAADRLKVVLTPGTVSQSETLMRAEAILEKVPGSAGVARKAQEREAEELQQVIDNLISGRRSAEEFGVEVSQVLTRQRDIAGETVEQQRRTAETITNQRIREIEQSLTTRPLSFNEAGELARRNIERAKTKFKADQGNLNLRTNNLINQLPPERQAFASTVGLKKEAKRLEGQFPKQTIVKTVEEVEGEVRREVIPELFPSAARRLLRGIDRLDDNVTVQELRNARNGVSIMIGNAAAFPGVGVGMLKKLEAEYTQAIRTAINNAPNDEIRIALTRELDHFKDGVGAFQTRPVAMALKGESQPGFREGEDVLPSLFLRDRPEDIQRVLNVIGADSIAARSSRRAAFGKILRDSADPVLGDGVADPVAALRRIERMSPKTQELLFGGRQGRVKELFRLSAARYGNIDLTALKAAPGDRDILELLEGALQNEVANRRIFESRVFRRILADEIDVTKMRPDQFVRYTMRDANINEIDELFRRLDLESPDLANQFRTQAAAHILSKADNQSADVIQALARIDGKITPSDKLDNVLRQFAEDPKDSLAKLKRIFGDDGLQLLKDMATVQAARAQKRASAAAAGGLIGGTIMGNIMNAQLGSASRLIKYRVLAGLINFGPTRSWLTGRGIPVLAKEGAKRKLSKSDMVRVGGVTLPEFATLMVSLYGEASEEAKLAREIEGNLDTIVP